MSMEEFDSKAFENKPVETEVFENRAFEMDNLDNMKDDIIFEADTQDFDTAQNEHQKNDYIRSREQCIGSNRLRKYLKQCG